MSDILAKARDQVLERGEGLDQDQTLQVLRLPDENLDELLELVGTDHHASKASLFVDDLVVVLELGHQDPPLTAEQLDLQVELTHEVSQLIPVSIAELLEDLSL